MGGRRTTETVGAIAGAALVVLVFQPWWVLDPDAVRPSPGPPQAGALGSLNLYGAPDASAWDGLRNGALIWIATGVLGAALLPARRLGCTGPALRAMRFATLGAALISLAIAVVRLADPPFAGYHAAAAAYAGAVAIVLVAICAAAGLRGADAPNVRGRPIGDGILAVAGVVLVVLVCLPWWQFDPARLDRADSGTGWTAYVTDSVEFGPWYGFRPGALLWTGMGLLAVALAVAGRFGASERTVRRLRRAVVAAAVASLIVALARLVDPPGDVYSPTPLAYAATALIVATAISAAARLRR